MKLIKMVFALGVIHIARKLAFLAMDIAERPRTVIFVEFVRGGI